MARNVKRIFFFALSLLCAAAAYGAVFEKSRPVTSLSTEHFSIIFPEECTYSAKLLADNCESIFEETRERMRFDRPFYLIVVISPDSDKLAVSYTASPYNRIVVYDAPPDSESAYYGETLLGAFKREVVRAVALCTRDALWHALSTVISDRLQPTYLFNMPLSFVEGACWTMTDDEEKTLLDDRRALQLLSQAKLENKFPTWRQTLGARDIYPGKELSRAAGSAFAAYLQQRWGIQQYVNFWRASGSVYLFEFTAGIFQIVYSVPLREAWKDFEAAVPLPQDVDAMNALGEKTDRLFKYEQDSLKKFFVSGSYGSVWYDEAQREVVKLDNNKKRNALFTADGITRLSLSEDGKYLAVSYYKKSAREQFKKQRVRVYDLENEKFLRHEYELRDGCIVNLADGGYGVAGVYSYAQLAELRVHRLNDTSNIIFRRSFSPEYVPYMPVPHRQNFVACLIASAGTHTLFSASISDGTERAWNLPHMVMSLEKSDDRFLFSYLPDEPGAFVRAASIELDEVGNPTSILTQRVDISGGVYSPAIQDDLLIFSAHKANHFELRSIALDDIPLLEEAIVARDAPIPRFNKDDVLVIETRKVETAGGASKTKSKDKKFLGEYELGGYTFTPYLLRGLWIPLITVTDFMSDPELDYGLRLAPALGVTHLSQTNPLETTRAIFSFSSAFLDPDENFTALDNNFSLSGYVVNTASPVDLTFGGRWQFMRGGQYTLKVLAGVQWILPFGMNYQKFTLTFKQVWTASTNFIDPATGIETRTDGWANVWDVNNQIEFALTLGYENYHQAGMSAYEQRGLEASATQFFRYNSNDTIDVNNDKIDLSTLGFRFVLGFKLPKLQPFSYINNFVIGLPLAVRSQLFGRNGVSFETSVELLLFGWESHLGIPFLNLYVRRTGLKLGYNYVVKYDTRTFPKLDIRDFSNYANVFRWSEASLDDYIYATTEMELSPTIGFTTYMKVTFGLQYNWYLRRETFDVDVILRAQL